MPLASLAHGLLLLFLAPLGDERWRQAELAVRPGEPALTSEEVERQALAYLGRPYVMGGVGSPGFDCSGFTCRVYAESGYALPRVSRDQARAGRPVPLDALAPADLLFFVAEPGETRVTHVGLYLGDGELVHAASGQGAVVVDRLEARWFRRRLIGARRLLPDPGTSTAAAGLARTASVAPAPALELVEHAGADRLPPMLRRPARLPAPSFGPELWAQGTSELAVRAALLTEAGEAGLTLAPEAVLFLPELALRLALAVPLRLVPGRSASVGRLARASDYTRFLRQAELGLRGADLELRLSRLGDATLAGGLLLRRYAPGAEAEGVPGLTTRGRSPLSFFGGTRAEGLALELFADDVVGPRVFGAAAEAALPDLPIRAGLALATDQGAIHQGARRALTGAQASLGLELYHGGGWYAGVDAGLVGLRALSSAGLGARFAATGERRFSGRSMLRLSGHAAWLGAGAALGFLGPTYAVERAPMLALLAQSGGRAVAGGELDLVLGRGRLALSYADAFAGARTLLDRELSVLLEVEAWHLGGTRFLDLRAAYSARAFAPGRRVPQSLHGGLRLRWASWLFAEVYVERGQRLEGGAGLTVSWAP